jgi:negative regulator of flagellin synthesis FlgM
MQINGPSQVHGPHSVNGPHFNNHTNGPQSGKAAGGSPADQVDISPAAEAVIQAAEVGAAESGELRSELVARVRGEIASGTYETAEKLDGALNRLLDEVS